MKLANHLNIALKDCSSMPKGRYIWKQKTMLKLFDLGLVEKEPATYSTLGIDSFYPTQKGIEYLQSMEIKS